MLTENTCRWHSYYMQGGRGVVHAVASLLFQAYTINYNFSIYIYIIYHVCSIFRANYVLRMSYKTRFTVFISTYMYVAQLMYMYACVKRIAKLLPSKNTSTVDGSAEHMTYIHVHNTCTCISVHVRHTLCCIVVGKVFTCTCCSTVGSGRQYPIHPVYI